MTLLVVDWAQTRTIARQESESYATPACSDPDTRNNPLAGSCTATRTPVRKELNPLLPDNPSVGQVDKYFAVAMVGTVAAAWILPTTGRRMVLGGIVLLETVVVIRNHHIGVRASF
jgi:hypothetical protein